LKDVIEILYDNISLINTTGASDGFGWSITMFDSKGEVANSGKGYIYGTKIEDAIKTIKSYM
jgi:hypothetical protein